MATFEVGKTYYYCSRWYIQRYKVVKKTRCFVWLKHSERSFLQMKKIKYYEGEEKIEIDKQTRTFEGRNLYASCKWDKYWKIEKDEDGYEKIIKTDITPFYKMNTATLKMFKCIVDDWGGDRMYMYKNIIDYEDLVKEMVEDNTEDFDKDYYCLYYTCNKDINWDMINNLMYRNYHIKYNSIYRNSRMKYK